MELIQPEDIPKEHWVKLKGEAAQSSLVEDVLESVAEVLEGMGIEVDSDWVGDEYILTFTKKGE
jgi:hypothetical protein